MFELEQAVDGAHQNPFEAMKNSIEILVGTNTDLKDHRAAAVLVNRESAIAVLDILDSLAKRAGLAKFYGSILAIVSFVYISIHASGGIDILTDTLADSLYL